ncbi:MAG: hypothetical protein GX797_00830 [Chloroflexi bacterium]|nr:hypothetical protein [Chloroflexota bacterium]
MAYSFDQAYWEQKGIYFEKNEKLLSAGCFYERSAVTLTWNPMLGAPPKTAKYFVLHTSIQVVICPYGEPVTRPKMFVDYKDIKLSHVDGELKATIGRQKKLHLIADVLANNKHNLDMGNFSRVINYGPR